MAPVGGTSGPLSASAIVGQVVGSGSHILRIEGISGTKGLGNGTSIDSETFTAVETNFTISLLDQDGNPVPSYSSIYRHTFSNDASIMDEWGSALIKKSDLEKSPYLKNDAFCVRCDVTVVNKVFTKAILVSEVLRGVVKQEPRDEASTFSERRNC